jgi:purine-nucleoside phosphorylase
MGGHDPLREGERLAEAAEFVRGQIGAPPSLGLVLGSGLGVLAEGLEQGRELPTSGIPHFPPSTVAGHAGRLAAGLLGGVPVLALKGRVHAYEGYSQAQVVFPIRLFKALGLRAVITTNAVGCIDRRLAPGDLVLLVDQINLMQRNPLRGFRQGQDALRLDLSAAYSPRLRREALAAAQELGLPLREGVLGGVLGPSYETPAEIRMLGRLGADVVGMSTVPEVIAARQAGLEIASISCVTNFAAGIGDRPLDHAEVTETAELARTAFTRLLIALLSRL